MADTFATSFGVLNYSGMLFNKGNVRTPLSSIIGSKAKTTNHVEFVTGQEYTSNGNGSQPAISESASLTAPNADVVTRSQKTNVTQIFQESVGISYGKQSNMGTLSGINIAEQQANPMSELDFQVAAKIQKVNRDIEYTFINGEYNKATTSYENCSCQREIYDGNALYDAYLRAKSGSDWKPQVQRYEMTYLLDLSKMQRELKEHTYEFQPSTNFVINERGKTRPITGEQIRDRIAKHSLCDEVLTPAIKDHLIYDNGASQKGKGIDFTRRRLEAHLHRFFRENQSNDGYILLMDFSKYYDNIRHDKLMELFGKYVDNDTALWFLEKIVDNEKVDVSYMSDEEYESAMDDVFNSLEHEKVDKSLLTGKKFLRKHLNIGDQVAQDAGIAYPIPIDNYIKIVKGVKFYGRYMDDSYVIHKDKEFLKGLLIEIVEIAHDLGITVNLRKTRICKLSEMWRFLQIQYSLTDTGRVIHKIHPKRLTGMRRKAKKLALILSEKDFDDWFRSWFNGHCHYMSKLQRSNMLDLCKKLKEEHYYGKTDFS